jgi:uncharacterized repeat protein (TIGR03803 family)
VLYSFCSQNSCADGANPSGVVVDQYGTIYGTAGSGGAHQQAGTLFEITGTQFQKLYDFCSLSQCADGSAPLNLAIDASGNVFGVTSSGGVFNNGGTIFELSP